jgi:transcriptional regulator with XRE-family HTH domain
MNSLRCVLGVNVRFYRQQLKLSQDELADRAKVSKKVIQKIEAGMHNPTLDVVMSLATALLIGISGLVASPKIILNTGVRRLADVDWSDGGDWAFGARLDSGRLVEVSESFEKFTGLCPKETKSLEDARKLVKIDGDKAVIMNRFGVVVANVVRSQLIGPDYEPIGWLSYGYRERALKCAFQIQRHLSELLKGNFKKRVL